VALHQPGVKYPKPIYINGQHVYTLEGTETPEEQVRLHQEACARLERQRLRHAEAVEAEHEAERERPVHALERLADAAERIAAALERHGAS
jgi:hypothetical protein